jgi:hypothetical protein
MGCGGSIVLDFEPTDICGQGLEVFEVCRMMDLTPTHLGVLFLAYIDIDSDARYPWYPLPQPWCA